jgi:hypothetical protein
MPQNAKQLGTPCHLFKATLVNAIDPPTKQSGEHSYFPDLFQLSKLLSLVLSLAMITSPVDGQSVVKISQRR